MNLGHAGLLVMNTAKVDQPIVIGSNIHHASEVQFAIDAEHFYRFFLM